MCCNRFVRASLRVLKMLMKKGKKNKIKQEKKAVKQERKRLLKQGKDSI
jgi:hypothetical protein